RLSNGRGCQFAELGQHGVHLQYAELSQELPEQFAKRLTHRTTSTVGLFDQIGNFLPKGQAVEGSAQLPQRRVCEAYPANWLRASRSAHIELNGLMFRIENPNVIHFREIMIFGGKPEYRNGRNAIG